MSKTILAGFVLALAIVATPVAAQAACLYPNYEDEDGRCVGPYERSYDYNYNYDAGYSYNNNTSYQARLETYIQELYRLLAILENMRENQYYDDYTGGSTRLEVTTNKASSIDEESARLNGEVEYNGEDEARVYFEWGESRTDLDERTSSRTLDDGRGTDSFSSTIDDLDEDETYYFRAVAIDEDGDRDYGNIRSFETDDDSRSNDDEPDVETGDAEDVTDDSAEIHGELDMNDYRNGVAFFVWGEDEDQVRDVEDDYDQYRDIDEDGDDLQKVLVDDDVDGSFDAWADIYGLDDDTDIYYSFCVEYEDEDNDEVIVCGGVEDFTTDD